MVRARATLLLQCCTAAAAAAAVDVAPRPRPQRGIDACFRSFGSPAGRSAPHACTCCTACTWRARARSPRAAGRGRRTAEMRCASSRLRRRRRTADFTLPLERRGGRLSRPRSDRPTGRRRRPWGSVHAHVEFRRSWRELLPIARSQRRPGLAPHGPRRARDRQGPLSGPTGHGTSRSWCLESPRPRFRGADVELAFLLRRCGARTHGLAGRGWAAALPRVRLALSGPRLEGVAG